MNVRSPGWKVVIVLSVVPTRRPVRRTGALALLTLLLSALTLSVLGVSPAAAHNSLLSSDPADASTVPTAPAQVTLTFDQPALEMGTQVVVTGPDGTVVSDGPAQLVDTSVVQPLVAARTAGAYTVDWRVTSADGHPLTGQLTFVATDPTGMDDPTPTPEPTAEATQEPTQAEEPTPEPTPEVVPLPAEPSEGDGVPAGVWVALGAAVLVTVGAAVTAAVVTSRRRAAGTDATTGTTPPSGEA